MDGFHIRSKRPAQRQTLAPSSDRSLAVAVTEKKSPAQITLPKESLKKIEKNLVKRQTNFFESSNLEVSGQSSLGNTNVTPHLTHVESNANTDSRHEVQQQGPWYQPSAQSEKKYLAKENQPRNQQDRHNANINDVVSSPYRYIPSAERSNCETPHNKQTTELNRPYKPRQDVSLSKSIGEQAKAKAEKIKIVCGGIPKSKVPERPKLPPSPGVMREKPKYPYKPSVETEFDAKVIHQLSKPISHLKVTIKPTDIVNTDSKISPQSPSPPVRPLPPKVNMTKDNYLDNSDKRVSKLISDKAKAFQPFTTDESGTGKAHLSEKPKVKLKPSISVDKSDQSNGVSICTNVSSTNMPEYTKFDLDKKGRDRIKKLAESSDVNNPSVKPKVTSSKPIETVTEAEFVQKRKSLFENAEFVGHKSNITTGNDSSGLPIPIAPPKPPRTFAYDEELKRKREKKEKKVKSREIPVSPLVRADHKYEDISEVTSSSGSRTAFRKLESYNNNNNIDNSYEDIASQSSGNHHFSNSNNSNSVNKSNSCDSLVRKKRNNYETLDDSSFPPTVANKPCPPPRPTTTIQQTNNPAESRWDKGYVRIKSSHPELKKKPIIGRRAVTNPGYELHHECIPIKTVYMKDGSLKRYKSDESLFTGINHSNSNKKIVVSEEPVYYDPVDVLTSHKPYAYVNEHGVSIDAEGYAVPEMSKQPPITTRVNRRYRKNIGAGLKRTTTMAHNTTDRYSKRHSRSSLHSNPSVKEKLNQAYSVLRKRVPTVEGSEHGVPASSSQTLEEDDSDSDVDMSEQEKKLDYISTTKLRIKDKAYQSVYEKAMLKTPKSPDIQLMFDYALIVGLENVPDTNRYIPKILYSFPHQDSQELPIIASFCFPDANVWRPVTHYRTETFSFVLTASDGSRQYGYCRRFLPPNHNNPTANRLPEVYCVITSTQSWSFYGLLLEELQNKRKISLHCAQHLLNAAFGKPFPLPGQDVWICTIGEDDTKDTVIINRSADDKIEKVSFERLIDHLSVDKLLKVFSSLLLERKLLFVAQHLGTLTECIHALVSLLYPFTWQHTFVPILPGNLLDVIDAPTPYILGTLASNYAEVTERDLTETMVIDLDNDSILHCMNDEDRIIPKKLQKALKAALKDGSVPKDTKNILVSEAFMRLFVETAGHYTNYINTQQDGRKEFQREMFVRAVSSKSIRMFLEWFSETQMFEVFVTERLENPNIHDGLFEMRLEEYQEEMSKYHPTVKQNIKDAGKKMINFLLESGGKIKKVFV